MDMKPWYKSRTIRLAIVQAIAGVFMAVLATYPELKAVGAIAIIKSVIDMALRYITDTPVL